MKLPLIALAVVVLVLVVAVWDPAGPVGPVVGWAIYLVLGVIVKPWGPPALAALAALAAIVWVLRQPTRSVAQTRHDETKPVGETLRSAGRFGHRH